MIIYTIIQILLTLAGAGVIGYSIYLTIQVSGDKLLTLDSELGYRYATSYHRWQLYAGIAIVSLLILWIVYILIVRAYRVKHREERLAKKAEKKNEKKIAREQKKQKKNTACKCSEHAATIYTRLLSECAKLLPGCLCGKCAKLLPGWLCGKCAKLLPKWLRNE